MAEQLVGATYFQFGEGTLTEGTGKNLQGRSVNVKGGANGNGIWVERSVFALGLCLGGALMML